MADPAARAAASSEGCTARVVFVVGDKMEPRYGGGPARIYTLIQHLRQTGCRVEIVCQDHGSAGNEAMRDWADAVWIFGVDALPVAASAVRQWVLQWQRRVQHFHHRVQNYLWRHHLSLYRRLGGWMPALFPPRVRQHSFILRKINPPFNQYARAVIHALQPDAVVAEFAWSARCLDGLSSGILKMIDTIDIQHLRSSRAKAAGSDLQDRACTREEEVTELRRADVLLAIQPEEAEQLRRLCPDREVIVVEHAEPPAPVRAGAGGQRVLFVGNLYDPNVQGLRQFLDEVWPVVRAACPEATLLVCGKVCKAVEGAPPAGVELAGFVDDLEACYSAAAVVVNPVPYGTGLKIKTVEALVRGKALVTTECGVEGLGEVEGEPFIVRPIETMADPLIALLQDVPARRRLEAEALAYAGIRFSEGRAYGALVSRLNAHQRSKKQG